MNISGKEIAKFACGFETFHALFHAYLLLSGAPFRVLGIEATPTWNVVGLTLNVIVAIVLGVFAWRGASRV